MRFSMKLEEKLNRINQSIEKYFKQNPSVSKVMAKDLMPLFIREGIFEQDHKNGLPIRSILRDLDKSNQLHLIPSVLAERKAQNTNWFFIRPRNINSSQVSTQPSAKIESVEKTKVQSSDKDEYYVLDMCDKALNQKASRQHKFDFLLGDAGTRLPVDAYYENLNLVIEYRERQHTEAVGFFDKPDKMTVSGVHRGEQRKLYDERRRKVLPENGIKLVEISYSDFNYDNQKRIIRDMNADINVVQKILIDSKILAE